MSKPNATNVLAILNEIGGPTDIPKNLSAHDAKLFAGIADQPQEEHNLPRCPESTKVCYPSQKFAKAVIRKRQKRGAPRLRCYLCPDCKSIHISSKS